MCWVVQGPWKQKVYQGLLLRSTPVEGKDRKKEEADWVEREHGLSRHFIWPCKF